MAWKVLVKLDTNKVDANIGDANATHYDENDIVDATFSARISGDSDIASFVSRCQQALEYQTSVADKTRALAQAIEQKLNI